MFSFLMCLSLHVLSSLFVEDLCFHECVYFVQAPWLLLHGVAYGWAGRAVQGIRNPWLLPWPGMTSRWLIGTLMVVSCRDGVVLAFSVCVLVLLLTGICCEILCF